MNMSLEARINDLETRLAFQDDTIQALNDVLVVQQRVVERLQMQLEALAKRQEELIEEFGSVDDDGAPPPHY
ncbi:SlyX family protein [Azotobacter vinelandii]|uniref:SlyX family protein n=1 Tax=Azotobacter vinelandii TaxID=354 RepID=UPI00266592FB|nr:SlyX family protein [Azotobacter vinelandii]WKN23792.1 SlyX family protein [Azotobacter vinelandii]